MPTLPIPRAELEGALREHVLDSWFPRCLDTEYGGYLCDFDRRWRPDGAQEKFLEFQARQTLLAADAFQRYPEDPTLRAAMDQGFRCLREMLWDHQDGGWFHRMDRSGRTALEGETKHAHGAAYAVEAAASVYLATGNPDALRLAQDGFAWLDRYVWDPVHGGYFGFLTRDNRLILRAEDCPWKADFDTMGAGLGLKDANVISDMVETLTLLYRAWPDETVRSRLAETAHLLMTRMVVAEVGAMHMLVTADWTPVPHLARAGYQFQTALRLLNAVEVVGNREMIESCATALVDTTLRMFFDDRLGGFYYAAAGSAPSDLLGQRAGVSSKTWWVQIEAIKTLTAMALLRPEQPRYRGHLEGQWDYLKRTCFDSRFGGIFAESLDREYRWLRRLAPLAATAAKTRKGTIWKDGSHEGRALLYCLEVAPA